MEKLDPEVAKELYRRRKDKNITNTEYIGEVVRHCFPGLVVKVINRKGGGLIHFSGLLLNNQEEMKNLKEVLYHSHYHFNTETVKREVERLGDLAVVGSCRYAAGPYEPLYQGD